MYVRKGRYNGGHCLHLKWLLCAPSALSYIGFRSLPLFVPSLGQSDPDEEDKERGSDSDDGDEEEKREGGDDVS